MEETLIFCSRAVNVLAKYDLLSVSVPRGNGLCLSRTTGFKYCHTTGFRDYWDQERIMLTIYFRGGGVLFGTGAVP